jgi:hypothetical protein
MYSIRSLRESPEAVRAELSKANVHIAVVVDADDAGIDDVIHHRSARAIRADDLIRILASAHGRAVAKRLRDVEPLDYSVELGSTLLHGAMRYALMPAGNVPLSPVTKKRPPRWYRCTGPLRHTVEGRLGDEGCPCPEQLADGSRCPGMLEVDE